MSVHRVRPPLTKVRKIVDTTYLSPIFHDSVLSRNKVSAKPGVVQLVDFAL